MRLAPSKAALPNRAIRRGATKFSPNLHVGRGSFDLDSIYEDVREMGNLPGDMGDLGDMGDMGDGPCHARYPFDSVIRCALFGEYRRLRFQSDPPHQIRSPACSTSLSALLC